MQAEIISNGDELTSGKILDTNSQWLSLELADLGVTTLYHTTIGDDLDAMIDVLKIAAGRADLIIWTGGLGPTADDLTREAAAKAFGVPLEKDEKSLELIKSMFARRGREMPKANEIQAFQPKGARPIFNPHGTAPGIDFTVKRPTPIPKGRLESCRFLAYPGVPAEMREMWNHSGRQTVEELLNQFRGQKHVIRYRTIHSFGAGESQVEAMLPDIVNRNHFPKVGITANGGTITLRIVAEAETEEKCFEIIEPTARLIRQELGDLVFGEGTDTLPDVVLRELQKQGQKLAVVEAGTRGLLAESLAGSSFAKNCFRGGIVLPAREPVSMRSMRDTACKLFDSGVLLFVGPYPPGEPDRNRNEEVFVGMFDGRPEITGQYPFVGHPGIIDDLFVKRALNLLRKNLVGLDKH